MSWNHNTHYHGSILGMLPRDCRRVLDVGCGQGGLARKLAGKCGEVVAIDIDRVSVGRAVAFANNPGNVSFVEGDVLTYPLRENDFDCVVAVATLHHLPLRAALLRFRDLLRPGGVLIVVGLYRMESAIDYAFAAAALPVSGAIRLVRGEEEVGAPLHEPSETLREIRREGEAVLPGVVVRRLLFFRYSLVWRKL